MSAVPVTVSLGLLPGPLRGVEGEWRGDFRGHDQCRRSKRYDRSLTVLVEPLAWTLLMPSSRPPSDAYIWLVPIT